MNKLKITNGTNEPLVIKAGAIIGTTPGGGIRIEQVPYMTDILNRLDPNGPAREVIVMKGQTAHSSSSAIHLDAAYIIYQSETIDVSNETKKP